MQQLALFEKPVSRSIRGRKSRGFRRNVRQGMEATSLDLWSQNSAKEKEMALLFLDIRNFTQLTEKHQASNVIHLMKKLFSRFQNIIRIHHGRIIETTGDGFYAAFGFNCDITKAINEAVTSGMVILNILEKLNIESFKENLGQRIEVGIGVHAGKVATGNLQVGSHEHQVVMGFAVNVASRIQAATKELNNNFVVSKEVFEMLTTKLLHASSVTMNLKGVTKPQEVFKIGNPYS